MDSANLTSKLGTKGDHFGYYPKQRGEPSTEIIRVLGEPSTYEWSVVCVVHRCTLLETDVCAFSCHYARAGLAHRGWRPGSTGEGRTVAHIPELHHITWRVDRESTQLER